MDKPFDNPFFHFAFTITDLPATKAFYGGMLGCREGRRSGDSVSVDYDFFGHHIVCHLVTGDKAERHKRAAAERDEVVSHFGLVLPWDQWEAVAERVRAAGTEFAMKPTVRDSGTPKEEGIFFLHDPSGNAIEFKAMRNVEYLYKKRERQPAH